MSNISQERSWWSSINNDNRIPMLIDHMSLLKPIEKKNNSKQHDKQNEKDHKQKFTVLKNVIPDEYQNLVQNVLSDMSLENFKDCKEIEFHVPNKLLFVASDSSRSNLSTMKRVVNLEQLSSLDKKLNSSNTNFRIDTFGSCIGVSFATIMSLTLKPLAKSETMGIKKFGQRITNKKLLIPTIVTVGSIVGCAVSSCIKFTNKLINNNL